MRKVCFIQGYVGNITRMVNDKIAELEKENHKILNIQHSFGMSNQDTCYSVYSVMIYYEDNT